MSSKIIFLSFKNTFRQTMRSPWLKTRTDFAVWQRDAVRIAAIMVLATLSLGTSAHAQVHANEIPAELPGLSITMAPATFYEWTVTRGRGDTVFAVHLLQGGRDSIRIFSSDTPTTSLSLRFFSFWGGDAQLIVRPVSGVGTVEVNQISRFFLSPRSSSIRSIANARISGTLIETELSTATFQTTLPPLTDWSIDPILFALDGDERDANIIASDDNAGVGANASLNAAGVRYLLLGNATCLSPGAACVSGPVMVYENDVSTDTDGDGLGSLLEAAVGTCSGVAAPPCAFTIAGDTFVVSNSQDTDNDGLSDHDELLGIDDAQRPQFLPRWGANPLHKDIFVEVDFASGTGPFDLTAAKWGFIRNAYADSGVTELRNPDGFPGAALHVDSGITPASPALRTLYGNWGGAQPVPEGFTLDDNPPIMAAVRMGVFRYALRENDSSSGQKKSDISFVFNGSERVFVHELGHTLGLDHFGGPGAGEMNCKPVHISVMNYLYDSVTLGSQVFSNGSRSAVLNPAQIYERDGIGTIDPRFASHPGILQMTAGRAVDWNFSGAIETIPVRAGVTFVNGNVCGPGWKNVQALSVGEPYQPATPALVRSDSHLFALWVQGFRIVVSSASIGGADEYGSCPLSDQLGEPCANWTSPWFLDLPTSVTSVAAARLGDSILILYRRPDGALELATAITTGGSLAVVEVVPLDVTTALEPELAAIYYGDDGGATRTGAGVFYVDPSGGYRWLLREAGGTIEQKGSIPVAGSTGTLSPTFAPGVVAWPDVRLGQTEKVRNCMAAPTATLVVIMCDQDGNGIYQRHSEFQPGALRAKPGLAFRIQRRADGEPLTSSGSGNFWMSYTVAADAENTKRRVNVAISAPYGDDPAADVIFGNWRFDLGARQNVFDGSGVALFADSRTSALKGLAVQPGRGLTTIAGEGQVAVDTPRAPRPSVTFLPFADATYRASLRDGNEWAIIRDGVCRWLRGDAYCGAQ